MKITETYTVTRDLTPKNLPWSGIGPVRGPAELRGSDGELVGHVVNDEHIAHVLMAVNRFDDVVDCLRELAARYGPSAEHDYKAKAAWLKALTLLETLER